MTKTPIPPKKNPKSKMSIELPPCCCCCGNSADADDFLCPFCFVFEIGVMVMLGELVRWAGRPAGTALAAGPAAAGEDCGGKGRFLDAIPAAAAAALEPLRRGFGCAPCCFGCG